MGLLLILHLFSYTEFSGSTSVQLYRFMNDFIVVNPLLDLKLEMSLNPDGENNDFYTVCNCKRWITPPGHEVEIPDAMGAGSDVDNVRLCMNIIHVMNVDNSSFGWALRRDSEIIWIRWAPSCKST